MKKKNPAILAIIVILGLLLTGVVGVLAYRFIGDGYIPGIDDKPDAIPRYNWECTITVKEKLIGTDVEIASGKCTRKDRCSSWSKPFFIQASGDMALYDYTTGKVEQTVPFETGFWSGEDTITVRGCLTENFGIRIYDDEGNLMDEWLRPN